jgi:hypothetical protein
MDKELRQVTRHAEAWERAEAALHDAIRAAHRAGASLRQIRDATGGRISHETVRVLCQTKTKGARHAR